MGMDDQKQEELLQLILSKFIVPFKYIGFAGMGLYTLVKAIGKALSSKEDPLITQLRDEVNQALSLYIETDLKASRNSLTATQARQTRCRSLLSQYREQMNKTHDEVEREWQLLEAKLLEDHLDVGSDDKMMSAINVDQPKDAVLNVLLSHNILKMNKWNVLSERIFLITRKFVFILNEYSITRKIEFSEMKGLTVLVNEDEEWPQPANVHE